MRKLLSVIVFAVVGISVMVILINTVAEAQSQKTIKLIYSSMILESTVQVQVDKWIMTELEKRSNGRVKFDKHYGGSLTSAMESLPALRSGAVDISNPPPAYYPEELPLGNMLCATRIPRDIKTLMDAQYKLLFHSGEVSKLLQEEAKRQNFIYLYPHNINYIYLTKPPVRRLSDLKGLKFRSTGLYEPKQKAKWGAISINVLPAEWYEALSRGSIDGISIPDSMAPVYKLHEVAKYVSFRDGCILATPFLINLNTWNKLPSDIRNMMEEMREEVRKYDLELSLKEEKRLTDIFRSAGCQIVEVDPKEQEEVWNSWIEVTLDVWLPIMDKKGLGKEGRLVLNRWMELSTGNGLEFWQKKISK